MPHRVVNYEEAIVRLLVALDRNRQGRILFRAIGERRDRFRQAGLKHIDRAIDLDTAIAQQHHRPLVDVVVDEDDAMPRRLHDARQLELRIQHLSIAQHFLLGRKRRTYEAIHVLSKIVYRLLMLRETTINPIFHLDHALIHRYTLKKIALEYGIRPLPKSSCVDAVDAISHRE